ncbi:hypothetical protein [Acidovorax sp. SUPP3334]|uniref:hypothetical protein n=1 Tax=Acidovorax sp. SUPP3334 TaxID=2920881 RepID=UPI0024E0FB9F|nr:hypothetical protein [Acidovorax sp. SUPP3334]
MTVRKLEASLGVRLCGNLYRWEYTQNGREFEVEVQGPLISNDGGTLVAARRPR